MLCLYMFLGFHLHCHCVWKEQCPLVLRPEFSVYFYMHSRELVSFRLLAAGLDQSAIAGPWEE